MRKLIYAGVAIVVLLGGGLLAAPLLISTETIRDTVIAAVRDNTGRTLTIKGDLGFSLLPGVSVKASQVALSNPPGFTGKTPFAAMDRMRIKLNLMSLLTGNVAIEGFVLIAPRINLLVDREGRNNWSFSTPGAAGSGDGGPGAMPIGVVDIRDGQMSYSDAQKNTRHDVTSINLKVTMASLSDTLKADGDLVWNGEKVAVNGSLDSLARLTGGAVAKLAARITAKSISAEVRGDVSETGGIYKIANAKLDLDGLKAAGEVTIKTGETRPFVVADLNMDRLDLARYSGAGPADKGKSTGWSKESMDFSGLKSVDGDIKLAVAAMRYKKIEAGATTLAVKLRDGVLTANMPSLRLYGGTARLDLTIDGRKKVPSLKSSGEMKNVNALPLLRDAADTQKIEGRANVKFNLTSAGESQHAIMSALDGTADVNFQKGALLGINIGKILRSVQAGRTSGFAKGGKTPFGAIVANYKFRKGVGSNRNFKMSGGEVQITGGGKVTMPSKTLNYRVNPSLVGKGGISVLGVNVPIIIAGPWASPKIYPDLPGILDAPEMALKGLSSVGKGGVKGGVKGVTGVVEKVIPIGPKSKTKPIGKILKTPFKKLF